MFEDHGVSWLHTREELALEIVVHRRCSLRRPLSAAQAKNRHGCVLFLQEIAAVTADLPPHSAVSSLQLLDLTHEWSEVDSRDIHINDVTSRRQQSTFISSCTQRRFQTMAHFLPPNPAHRPAHNHLPAACQASTSQCAIASHGPATTANNQRGDAYFASRRLRTGDFQARGLVKQGLLVWRQLHQHSQQKQEGPFDALSLSLPPYTCRSAG